MAQSLKRLSSHANANGDMDKATLITTTSLIMNVIKAGRTVGVCFVVVDGSSKSNYNTSGHSLSH